MRPVRATPYEQIVNWYRRPRARTGHPRNSGKEGGKHVPQPPPPAANEYLVVKVRPGPPRQRRPNAETLVEFDVGAKIPVFEIDQANEADLLAKFGVNQFAGIAGTQDRTVKLSERSNICCPAHGFTLKPDACRSCAFLAGEVRPEP
jgi:hypothetical protein